MNQAYPRFVRSTCPHDCPSVCGLEVELLDARTIGRVRGQKDHPYTAGVICEKVARYAERLHNPARLTLPLLRVGPKGQGDFRPVSWDEALDRVAEAFLAAEAKHGAEAVWPYYYAGTMGLVQRDGINRLRHAKGYSGMYGTFCVALTTPGFEAGAGRVAGVDSREMREADLIICWGTNPVHTQVNVMTHVAAARKARGTRLACVDIYDSATMQQADIRLVIRPGTDAALACAVMHVLFRDDLADRDYLDQYTDDPAALEAHLQSRTPDWAAAITGCPAAAIEAFARLIGQTPRSFFRLGYGFTRQRNGAMSMHAALSIPAVSGAWRHRGGGALYSASAQANWDKTLIQGLDVKRARVRTLDQCRIGAVLAGAADDLRGGPPVTALFIQNTNPAVVAPDQTMVRRGLARDDLFTVVHEQVMTETARYADVVLPATMFLEHDDIYGAGGHAFIQLGLKQLEPPGDCRSNHEVICALAKRLGADHRGFDMSARDLIDETLLASGHPSLAAVERAGGRLDVSPDFETAHQLKGFGHADGRFHFRADWQAVGAAQPMGALGPVSAMPGLPDYWPVNEGGTAEHPFRLATSPARSFLNSSFNETPTSRKREGRPSVLVHPDDLAALGIGEGARVRLGNRRGTIVLHAKAGPGQQRGVLIAEGLWPNDAHEEGFGINVLTGADQPAPAGGGAFHDIGVWLRPA